MNTERWDNRLPLYISWWQGLNLVFAATINYEVDLWRSFLISDASRLIDPGATEIPLPLQTWDINLLATSIRILGSG